MRRASPSFSSTTVPMPSHQPVPLASAPKDRQRPSGESAPWALNSMNPSGVDMTVVPPVSARSQSPLLRAATAVCRATRDEEHMVSIVRAGPSNPRV